MIKGNTVTLLEETSTELDPFGQQIKQQIAIEVDNVLVSPTDSRDVVEHAQLYGKKAVYTWVFLKVIQTIGKIGK